MYRAYPAYKGDRHYKKAFLGLLKEHYRWNQLIRGSYGTYLNPEEMFQGTDISCALRGLDLLEYLELRPIYNSEDELARRLQIPVEIVRLGHWVFENIINERLALRFPLRLYEALPVGADLRYVWPRLAEQLPSMVPEPLAQLLAEYVMDPVTFLRSRDNEWSPYRAPDGLGMPAAVAIGEALLELLGQVQKEQARLSNVDVLVAYHSDPDLKKRFVKMLRRHRDADALMRGSYGAVFDDGWRGCAVACSLRSLAEIDGSELRIEYSSHGDLAARMGIPLALTWLEEAIFESLHGKLLHDWPISFAEAIQPGADLSSVWPKFSLWALETIGQPISQDIRAVLVYEAESGREHEDWEPPPPAPVSFHSAAPIEEQFVMITRRSWEGYRLASIITQLIHRYGLKVERIANKILEIIEETRP